MFIFFATSSSRALQKSTFHKEHTGDFLDELASENPTIQKMSDSQEQAVRELARAMDTGTIEPLDVVTTTLSAGQETHDDAFVARLQQALSALDIRDEAPRLTAEAQSEEASSSAYAD